MATQNTFLCRVYHPREISPEKKGEMGASEILHFVSSYDWKNDLAEYSEYVGDQIYNTPSIEIENQKQNQILKISNISSDYQNYKYFIGFTRPVVITYLWGLWEHFKKQHRSEKKIKTESEMQNILKQFLDEDLNF